MLEPELVKEIVRQHVELHAALDRKFQQFRSSFVDYIYDLLQFYYTYLETHPGIASRELTRFQQFLAIGDEVHTILLSIEAVSETDYIELRSRLQQMVTIQRTSFLRNGPPIAQFVQRLDELADAYCRVEHTLNEVNRIEDYF